MTPTRQERNENIARKRKQQILDAALVVFSMKGFSNSSTMEIAKKAGIAQGTIFHYYPTKQALLMAVVEENLAPQQFKEMIQQLPTGSPVSKMAGIIENRLKSGFTNIDGLMFIISEIQRDQQLREYYREKVLEPLMEMAGKSLETGISKQDLQPLNKDLIVRFFMGSIMGLIWLYRLEGDKGMLHRIPPELISSELTKVFFEGIGRKP
jgi:AcrR family transcriptional regulator